MKIIIVGAGEVGSHLAKMLYGEANEVTVIDNDHSRLEKLTSSLDVETFEGNPSSVEVLRRAGAGLADLFIAVCPYVAQEVNVVSSLIAKTLGAGRVVARVNEEEYLSAENKLLYKQMGIELMLYPERMASDEIIDLLKHSAAIETMDFARGKLQIAVFRLDENSQILDLKLSEFSGMMKAEELNEFRVIAISRGDKTIIPRFDTVLQYNDIVFTISTREGMAPLARYFGKADMAIGSVMIVGGTSIGEMLARDLSRQGFMVKLIDKSRERCIELSEKLPGNVIVVNGDARNTDFLFEESIRDYDAMVALTGSDEINVLTCVVAKKLGVSRTVAEVENIEYIRLAEEMGVDNVINKKLIAASRIFRCTLSGKARMVRYMSGTSAEVIEYTVAPGSPITKGPLRDIPFPKSAIIGGVIRGNDSFIAVGDTVIESYDRVAIFALPKTISEIDRFFR